MKHHTIEPFRAAGMKQVTEVEQVVVSRNDEELGAIPALPAQVFELTLGGEQQQRIWIVSEIPEAMMVLG
ncbi:hypothetical protein ACF1BQ_045075 [Bradyrhizobium sp. RDT10]